MPQGTEKVEYTNWNVVGQLGPKTIPAIYRQNGAKYSNECQITLNAAGQNHESVSTFSLIPDDLRAMVDRLLNECMGDGGSNGVGGYATANISNTVEHITDPTTNLAQMYPNGTTFLTITLSMLVNLTELDYPGNYHPTTGSTLAQSLMSQWLKAPENGTLYNYSQTATLRFYNSALAMVRGQANGCTIILTSVMEMVRRHQCHH
ncbi:hypothetical protein MMC06_002822 [Schaereria dolodes]|nr:hypothetical protein [Schaereria dolodes]